MKLDELKQKLGDYTLDFSFVVNGKNSGITTYEVNNGTPTITMWYGDKEKEYNDPKDLLDDPFFDGKSLNDLASSLTFEVD